MEIRTALRYGVLAVVAIGGIAIVPLLPRTVFVERSVQIAAPPDVVYAQVADLTRNENWSPWRAADPTMVITLGGNTSGQGASLSWTSDDSGSGSMTIAAAEPNTRIETSLDFSEQGSGRGLWTFEAKDGGTLVTWAITRQAPGVFGGLFALMADGMIGPSLESGLTKLEEVAEKEAG